MIRSKQQGKTKGSDKARDDDDDDDDDIYSTTKYRHDYLRYIRGSAGQGSFRDHSGIITATPYLSVPVTQVRRRGGPVGKRLPHPHKNHKMTAGPSPDLAEFHLKLGSVIFATYYLTNYCLQCMYLTSHYMHHMYGSRAKHYP